MADRRPQTSKTTEELVRRLPGYKPIPPKADIGKDGEPIPPPEPPKQREPLLPQFKVEFQPVIKDETDSLRQEQMTVIQSLRDHLTKSQMKRDDKSKTDINIPMMKTFERAMLLP